MCGLMGSVILSFVFNRLLEKKRISTSHVLRIHKSFNFAFLKESIKSLGGVWNVSRAKVHVGYWNDSA